MWNVEAFDPENNKWVFIATAEDELGAWSIAACKQPWWPAPIRYYDETYPELAIRFEYTTPTEWMGQN
jgi:hypothetical protein